MPTAARNNALESKVRHLPSTADWTRLSTTTWVCSCGSPARESQWSNAVATTPRTSSDIAPACPVRVASTCVSPYAITACNARRWAAWIRARVVLSVSAHATETLFGTEKVRSNPATDCFALRTRPRWSTNTIPAPVGARPSCSPVTGSCSIPSIRHSWSSLTCEPGSAPAPPARPSGPAPRNQPGGVPVAVIPRQPGRPGGFVGTGDRGHEVAVPGTQRHASDRHRHGRTTAPRGHHERIRRQSHQMRLRPRKPPRCQTCEAA